MEFKEMEFESNRMFFERIQGHTHGAKINAVVCDTFDTLQPWLPWAKQIPTVQDTINGLSCLTENFQNYVFAIFLKDQEHTLIGMIGLTFVSTKTYKERYEHLFCQHKSDGVIDTRQEEDQKTIRVENTQRKKSSNNGKDTKPTSADINVVHQSVQAKCGEGTSYEVGYWIHEKQQGMGLCTESVRCVVKHAQTHLNAVCFILKCRSDNIASQRVATKSGFSKISEEHRTVESRPDWGEHVEFVYGITL